MKKYLLSPMLLMTCILFAQEEQTISTGNGYNFQSYASLETGVETQVQNAVWDIAFSVAPGDAGIFINESVGSGAGLAAIQLYYTLSGDFSAIPEPSFFEQFPLSNPEDSWSYGAFNETRIPEEPTDYGWGFYDEVAQEITGFGVFVVELRTGNYLKIQIQSLANDVYTFRYAELDGSNEVNATISKEDHTGRLLAYYSFGAQGTVDIEPAGGFDLLFCRYTAHLADPGGGDPIPYLVTGILSGPGVQVAQADGVDPQMVMFEDYQDSLSDNIEIIGHDWKEFDLGAFEWVLPDDRAYFVRTANGRVWKIVFTDFAGSSTGTATFTKTDLGVISGVKEAQAEIQGFNVFPNPTSADIRIAFSMNNQLDDVAAISLWDAFGKCVISKTYPVVNRQNDVTLATDGLNNGLFYLTLSAGKSTLTRKIQIIR